MQQNAFQHELYRTWTQRFILMGKGFTMGAADIIPGVSGGTIALISGIYEHLIASLSSVAPRHIFAVLAVPFWIGSPDRRRAKFALLQEIPWIFLIFLATGILLGLLSMSRLIPFFMDNYPFQTYSFFFGLILFSVSIPYKMMQHGWKEWVILTLFTAATFWTVTLAPLERVSVNLSVDDRVYTAYTNSKGSYEIRFPSPPESIGLSFPGREGEATLALQAGKYAIESNTTDLDVLMRMRTEEDGSIALRGTLSERQQHTFSMLDYAWLWFTGALAVCAMILPGISGAYILVLLGEYRFLLQSAEEGNLTVLAVFGLGVLTGILSFVHLLKYLLKNFHSFTMAALTGFLAGSLGKIWPFPYLDRSPDTGDYGLAIAIAAFGAALLFILERLSRKLGDPEPPGAA